MGWEKELSTVLIVDDEPEGRAAIIEALGSQISAKIQECDGSAALHRFLDQQPWTWFPSIVIVDLVLPAISGYDVVRRLRARFVSRKIPIIVASKLSTGEDILEAQVAGADAFVRKPFTGETLITAIQGCLDESKKAPTDKRYSIAYYL